MKKTIVKNVKVLLLAAFVIGAFGQTFSTASPAKKKNVYPLACTFTGDWSQKCKFTLNGGDATADGCIQGGTSCSVIIPTPPPQP